MAMAQQKNIKHKTYNLKFLKNKKIQLFLQVILVLIIVFNVGSVIWQYKDKYLSSNYWQNFSSLEKTFLDSQYVNKHPKWIRDEVAFSYSGGKLIRGTSPVLVVPDAPPLGKYIIGLSVEIFNNDSIFILLSGILSLVILYLLSFQVLSNRILSIIPSLLLSFEPMFKNQFIYTPLLDLFQLVFLLCSFYFFNKGLTGKKIFLFFALASLFLGFFIATKFFITGFVIIASFFMVLLYNKDKERIIKLTVTLPISLFVLLLSYVRVFAFGYNIHDFLGIQKWVFLYHKSFLILPLSVWPLLLFNKWYVWFGDKPVISDSQWLITWPILTVISIITTVLYIFKKIPKKKEFEILLSWFFAYMLFMSLGQTFSRYFVILIPVLYIISLYGLVSLYKAYKK